MHFKLSPKQRKQEKVKITCIKYIATDEDAVFKCSLVGVYTRQEDRRGKYSSIIYGVEKEKPLLKSSSSLHYIPNATNIFFF